jgi:hypothetical protein
MGFSLGSLSAVLNYDWKAQVTVVQYRDANGQVQAQTPTDAAMRSIADAGKPGPSSPSEQSSTSKPASDPSPARISILA